MALGGGTFVTQNKVLPGAYINFISVAKASANLSDRGIAAMALELDWGVDSAIIEVTKADFQKNSLKIFGYPYTDDKMKGLRDLFSNITTLYTYKLTSGGVKASNTFATAKYCGTRGNDLKVVIQANVDAPTKFDVFLYLGTTLVDSQVAVSAASALVSNDFVDWKTSSTLAVTASTPLTGGTNGTVSGTSHQAFLDKIESYSVNAIGVVSTDAAINSLYTAFVKRLRDEVGVKFQAVVFGKAADYEGVVNVKNAVTDSGWSTASLVYWVTGIIAGCAVNKSNTNKVYDGEFTVNVDYTQAQLEAAIKAGEFTLHQVGSDIRVLEDINSLVTISDTKGDIFKDNQTVRVIDQIANDIATLFATKYLGTVPNDASGRTSLWADIVKHHEQLQTIRAIEDFSDKDVTIAQGDSKKAVVVSDVVTVVNAMTKLYMTVQVQ